MAPLSIPFKVFGLCVQNHLFAILFIVTGKKRPGKKDQADSFALSFVCIYSLKRKLPSQMNVYFFHHK